MGNTAINVSREIYFYWILNNPVDPTDTPINSMGIIVIVLYSLLIILFLISTNLLFKVKKSGIIFTDISSLIGIWSLFPLTLITGLIQLYTLNYHIETQYLFIST